MGLLDRLREKVQPKDSVMQSDEALAAACTHPTIAPRWENPDDIGKEDRATAWVCGSCSTEFNADEAKELRAQHEREMIRGDR